MAKKRILLIWWELDHRPELLQPFIDMSDELEFIQLIYKNKEERTTSCSPFKMIYWFDYVNAKAILKDIKPSAIVGTSESIFIATLINSARKAGIPFYGLQHGITTENISELLVDPRTFSWKKVATYIKSTTFFFCSFSIFNFKKFCSAAYFFRLYPKYFFQQILTDHHFPWATPQYYVCFSEYASEHYKEMYHLKDEQVKYIGIIWFDKLFKNFTKQGMQTKATGEKYYLLIDTCFKDYHKPITSEQTNRCYKTLSDFCEEKGARLLVKLHPWNYENKNLIQHPNIEYVRKVDDDALHALIRNCEGCFSFYSTLILPVLAFTPVVQIEYDGIYLKPAKEKGLTPVIDFYSFEKSDIHFPSKEMEEQGKKSLEYLLYKTDGNAVKRLEAILLAT
ncbi:MAG: polysialyltransferase family glycosyltransferase [Ferruginibacter sp.]